MPLGKLTVITGANGTGKSSVYRAMRLLADIANGGVIRSLIREGGLSSTLWAGPESFSAAMLRGEAPVQGTRRKTPVNLRLGFAAHGAEDFSYAIDIGLPTPRTSAFTRDPEIKREAIWSGPVLRPATLLVDRQGPLLRTRGDSGGWERVERPIPAFASMMTEYADPRGAPEMLTLREQMRSWRFYDHFRTDTDAPARQPQLGTYTPVLAHDGADLAAAFQTIREIGDGEALDRAVDDASTSAICSAFILRRYWMSWLSTSRRMRSICSSVANWVSEAWILSSRMVRRRSRSSRSSAPRASRSDWNDVSEAANSFRRRDIALSRLAFFRGCAFA